MELRSLTVSATESEVGKLLLAHLGLVLTHFGLDQLKIASVYLKTDVPDPPHFIITFEDN